MSHRKWWETKHQLIWWHEVTLLGCCLVSLHFLCDILSSHSVLYHHAWRYSPRLSEKPSGEFKEITIWDSNFVLVFLHSSAQILLWKVAANVLISCLVLVGYWNVAEHVHTTVMGSSVLEHSGKFSISKCENFDFFILVFLKAMARDETSRLFLLKSLLNDLSSPLTFRCGQYAWRSWP